ncbi:amino acid ABC transporter permease [Kitasatospora aureofaciens]|uniref:ABC transporter permease n=1 Tax=Kitasatospora aureofaciens TaxID=1894 RepID=A0A1E7MZL6_KITAU|nr:amino acid ABC transporter permease [Kitasatospora aureofaciens]QEU99950.1 amino acid ABC transporter permease [Streptomyces viridifaciens]ARF78745.1 ABC transporter permease [Kitasatospora aureofaciens]OEV33876.1 ABC transporter permease [Kitasatospora aureofaciens]UKZ06111.1 amino acid ABC transporter permease [Streptomyces viridifaciens]GGU77755.1 polar amino acid ABC transporter permease [Kitasatospora aureofaciens]
MNSLDKGAAEKGRPETIKAVPVRHPGRWAGAVVIALLAAMLLSALFTNPAFKWDIVGQYLFHDSIMHGLLVTLELTALSMLMGVVGGIVLAVMRLSPNPLLAGTAWVYIWVFRGTPVLVQLVFWNFLGLIWAKLSIGVPWGPEFWSEQTNVLIPTFVAALLGLGLNEAAYMAEIVRGGIQSVDEGQTEAAHALGMSRFQTMRRIVLPQAMRVIIPPTGNETISMLKTTSLVSVISLEEIFRAGQVIYSRNYQNIPLLIVVSLWYLFFTSVLTIGQYYIERYYARGSNRTLPPTPLQRLRGLFAGKPTPKTNADVVPGLEGGGHV